MAEIRSNDVVEDKLIEVPLILTKNFKGWLDVIDKIIVSSGQLGDAIDVTASTKKVRDATAKLTDDQKVLVGIQKQIATAVAKNNSEYIAQEKVLQNLRKVQKERSVLGDKDAKQVNAMNSSLLQIEAALKKNRQAWAQLTTEEERQSETGKELLGIIQEQAAAQIKLREELVQFGPQVGNYAAGFLKAQEAIKKQEAETLALIRAQDGLDDKTDEGKQAQDKLRVAIQNNITQINIYRKETGMAETSVEELTKEQKKLEKATKDTAKATKGAGESLDGFGDVVGEVSPEIGGTIGKVQSLGKALLSLAANPVGAALAALVVTLAALAAYFTGSIEGQDRWGRVMTWLVSIVDVFRKDLEVLGEYLVDLWDEPTKALDEFVEMIKTNLINRVKAFGVLFNAFALAWKGQWADAAKEMLNAWYQWGTGITDITGRVDKFRDRVAKNQIVRDEIELRNAKFRKDAIQDIIDDSRVELEVSKLLAKVKDDLRYADQDRLVALRKANELLADQAKGDIELAQQEYDIFYDTLILKGATYDEVEKLAALQTEVNNLTAAGLEKEAALAKERYEAYRDTIPLRGQDYAEAQKLAELEAKVNDTEKAFFEGQKRRLSEEFSLVTEINNKRIAAAKAIQQAYDNLASWRLQHEIDLNKQILDEELSSLDQRYKAIVEMTAQETTLVLSSYDEQLEAALEASRQRVNLSTEERQKIFMNQKLSIDEQLRLQAELITAKAEIDQGYVQEAIRIEEEKAAAIDAINKKSAELARNNAFAVLARDANIAADQVETQNNEILEALNKSFADGNITMREYLKAREEITAAHQEDQIERELGYVNEQIVLAEEGSQQMYELEKRRSELELQLADETARKKLEYEQQLQQGLTDLRTAAVESAFQIIDNLNAGEDMKRAERLEQIQTKMEEELAMAGTNEEAKVMIQQKAAAEEQKIKLQQAAADRKRAIFEKASAAVTIAINTARGIMEAVAALPLTGGLPFSAIIGAIGAVQLAAVLTKPIPSYEHGTKGIPHEGGLARVAEKGFEMMISPRGEIDFTPDSETIMEMEKGTHVIPHHETVRALALSSLARVNETPGNRRDSELGFNIVKGFRSLEKTIKQKPNQVWNIDRHGMRMMMQKESTRTWFMDNVYS